ncbi:MAG: hypothetical protein QXP36_05095 [Conexivisphaerales archaeon]
MRYACFLLNKSVTIPENHYTLLFLGEQGVGKSQLASLTVKQIAENEGFPVVVVCDAMKEKTIDRWWKKNVPEHSWWKGLTFGQIKKLSRCVLVLEDLPLLLRSKARAMVVKSILTALSRENRIFTVVTSQYALSKELKTTIPLKVECQVVDGRYLYRANEWKNHGEWIDWTANPEAKPEAAKPIVDAVYHGVKGKTVGRVGGKINENSLRQKAFQMFNQGRSNKEVRDALGCSSELIRHYRYVWNEQRKFSYSHTHASRKWKVV